MIDFLSISLAFFNCVVIVHSRHLLEVCTLHVNFI